jgi:hypothetical protein
MGCGCLGGILGLIIPRILLIGMWLFTPLVSRAFAGPILPALGLILAPFTTMAYAFFAGGSGGMTLIGWIVVGLALLLDVGVFTGAGYANRDKIPSWKQKGYDNP